jgi:LuxR family transcriptional regulator, maltose regulon positive regulatory protein
VLLEAPAGYGKTTVLSEWAVDDERAFPWVTLDQRDDDPARLLASIISALEQTEPVEPGVSAALSVPSPNISGVVLPRLGASLAGRKQAFVLVLDDVHCLSAPEAFETLEVVASHLPRGGQLALASRTQPALPLGRMRAHRGLIELTRSDLAMTRAEAGQLLEMIGIELGDADLATIVERTEGWPAALYLAGLAFGEQPNLRRAVAQFAGDDQLVVDYLRDEFLGSSSPRLLKFLTRTSVLDLLSGPLCDAVLERSDSTRVLHDLARSNMLLIPLDRTDGWYRYHGLLAEMLLSELRRLEPDEERGLHRRASAWYTEHVDLDRAVDHAIAAGDVPNAAELIWSSMPSYAAWGRAATMQRWLEHFGAEQIAANPHLALSAAHGAMALGDGAAAEHFARAAARCCDEAKPGEGRTLLAGEVAIMEATIGRCGVKQMGEKAARGSRAHPQDSPWQSASNFWEGVSAHLTGDSERALERLKEGARRGIVSAPVIQVLALAQLTLLALERDDRQTASILASQARAQIERSGLGDYPSMALVLAVSAMVSAQEGRSESARKDMKQSVKLLGMLVEFPAWYEAEARIVLARASIRLDDPAGARALLADASRFLDEDPDAVTLVEMLEKFRSSVDEVSAGNGRQRAGLTPAELRLLPFLPTHLSLREIADRLFISQNTVKTQAQAVYRKLDCSGRAEAVEKARQTGLLEGSETAQSS